ncbi:hypothetical protein V6N12_070913 [Hibiscus sabdariffa]|uniref:Uncharacterized protein n=1 Tax=Hibiscus sabdariffa TaxID=183260 RepID=A0ABR2FI83_9ROSI
MSQSALIGHLFWTWRAQAMAAEVLITILVPIETDKILASGFAELNVTAIAVMDHETSNGWPLGLQIMTMRLGLRETYQGAAPAAVEPYSLHIPSSSFSSFSSSNLDTESSASFFQDSSVSLGKLIGLGAGERGALHLQNTISTHQSNRRLPVRGACNCKDVSRGHGADTSQGICIPLVLGALLKISSNRMKSKRLD